MKTFDNSNLVAINVNQEKSLACVNRFKKNRISEESTFQQFQIVDRFPVLVELDRNYDTTKTKQES